ncbi:MAG: DUF3857 domain-containing protein [Acidobacteriota bacterium]
MRQLWLGGIVGLVCASRVAGADPLDKPAFTASPAELLAAASAAPASDADAIVLREDATFTFDDKGRAERSFRIVFAIRKQAAVDGWGTLELDWQPFYQDKPTVRARVIVPGGQVSELDPKLVTDAPSVSESPSVFSDRRDLEAPLPRLVVGCVVEEQYVLHDREALIPAGVVEAQIVGRSVPVRRTVVSINAPTSRAMRVVARGFAKVPQPRKTTRAGRTSWLYDFGPVAARPRQEEGLPSDVAPWPWIGVASAASWAAVAQDYRRIVDDRLAQGTFTLPDGIRGATPRDTLARAVTWLHAHVRYTGIELSDSAIAPWPPAEVLRRGFGDCKDKASLLVAILRAAGLHADVALLSTGPGRDVDRELPGMGEFDHAIVRVKLDGKDAWIDATESDLPVGQLPARDQGRLALIAAADTRDLVTIPMSAPADNVVREVRTYHLAEHDAGTVTEVTYETGTFSANLREWVREGRHDDLEKFLGEYVDREYHGKLASFSTTDPADVAKPFALTVDVNDVARAFTKRQQIDVYLFPADTLARVPAALDKDAEDNERHAQFAWYHPHVYEIEQRLVLPPGYTAPQLRPHEQETVGTMTLTTDRRVENDTIVITYRLDSGKLRLSPADVIATRAAVRALRKRDGEHVLVAHTAWALAHQGKLPEAIAECQRLIALHPKEALHWGQLADMYRQAGMGAASRRAARKGVEVQPISDAYNILAYELTHDTLGRELGFDMDRKGAIAAYRKALELDPKHIGALADFASLLTRDARGQITTDKRDRAEAIALWRRAKAASKGDAYDQQIASNLLLAGDFAEAEKVARAMPESTHRSGLLVATVAASRGAGEALALASSLGPERDRKRVLTEAIGALVLIRRYDVARKLFDEVKDVDSDPRQVTAMAHLTAIDLGKLDPADPKTPALRAFAVLTGDDLPAAPPWDGELSQLLRDSADELEKTPEMRQFKVLPRQVANDMIVALAQVTVDGSASDGWRVTLDVASHKAHFYELLVRGKARLIGLTDGPGTLGVHVQGLLAKGDVRGAERWIKSFLDDAEQSGEKAMFRALARLYHGEEARGDKGFPSKELLDVLAATLLVEPRPKLAVPALRRCAVASEDIKKACRRALGDALFNDHQWLAAADVERDIADHDPTELDAVGLRASALLRAGHAPDAKKLLDDALAKSPDNLKLARERARVAIALGDWPDARAWFDKIVNHRSATVVDVNNAAWAHLYFDPTPDDARKLATRGEQMQLTPPPMFANTLAAIEAELDHPYTAWTYLQKSLAATGDGKPRDADWYVIGRIAESYGLRDDAIAAYRHVQPPQHPGIGPSDRDFVQRRLTKLGVH